MYYASCIWNGDTIVSRAVRGCKNPSIIFSGSCCTTSWSMDHPNIYGALRVSTFCSQWSTPGFFGSVTRGCDVTMFVYIFQGVCMTKSFRTKSQVPVTGDNSTWTQTGDGDYICSRFLWFSVNIVIVMDKIILLSLLVAILSWVECSSWRKHCADISSAPRSQLECSAWLSVHAAGP